MYFWKCWRDTRLSFVVLLALVIYIVWASLHFGHSTPDGHVLWPSRTHAPGGVAIADAPAEDVWYVVWWQVTNSFSFIPLWGVTGLILGLSSICVQIGKGSGDFLLTRPRSRKYFVWADWVVGIGEAVTILAAGTLTLIVTLWYEGFAVWRHLPANTYEGPWRATLDLPLALASIVVSAAVIYGFTYFLSVVTRSSSRAAILGITLPIAYVYLTNRFYWQHFRFPELMIFPVWETRPAGLAGITPGTYLAPAGAGLHILGSAVVALLFPLAAQLILECSDI